MNTFNPGFVHCPVTPFTRDNAVDYPIYAKVLDWHIRNGADALALPMPQAEDISLTDAELRELLAFAVKHVNGRVPVIAHVSDPGTMIAVERAKHAEKLGVAALASRPPYFWHPKPAMVIEHIVAIGSAVKLPFFVCTPPVEDAGTHMTAEMVLEVVERLDNVAGLVDASMRFVFMAEVASRGPELRPDFQADRGHRLHRLEQRSRRTRGIFSARERCTEARARAVRALREAAVHPGAQSAGADGDAPPRGQESGFRRAEGRHTPDGP